MSLDVSVADLAASAIAVSACGEELAAAFAAADRRCAAAQAGGQAGGQPGGQPGGQGLSAVALSAAAQRWAAEGAALLERLRKHAADLHTATQSFWQAEQQAAAALGAP